MTEHLSIQDPEEYSPEDMMRMAEALFAPLTPVEELERICMTLAHLPTEDAQALLARFKDSPRADEVSWLECAIDEGAYHMLTPRDELERREFLTLKVIEDLTDEIIDLEHEQDQVDLRREKTEIRLSAMAALAEAGRMNADRLAAPRSDIEQAERRLDELARVIKEREAMIELLRASITTPRYRNVNPLAVRSIHLDGEEGL